MVRCYIQQRHPKKIIFWYKNFARHIMINIVYIHFLCCHESPVTKIADFYRVVSFFTQISLFVSPIEINVFFHLIILCIYPLLLFTFTKLCIHFFVYLSVCYIYMFVKNLVIYYNFTMLCTVLSVWWEDIYVDILLVLMQHEIQNWILVKTTIILHNKYHAILKQRH